MSGFSFSHQFSKRWINTPKQVRQAITTELEDIVALLDKETALSDFNFNQQDLGNHLDQLFAKHAEERQAELARQEQERQEQQRLEEKRLEEERIEEQRVAEQKEAQRLEAQKQAEAEKEAQEKLAQEKQKLAQLKSDDVPDTKNAGLQPKDVASDNPDSDSKTDTDDKTQANVQAEKPPVADTQDTPEIELDKQQQAMIQALESRLDDYLTEQMMLMSDDLKTWLRDEVKRQLSDLIYK